MLPLCIYDHFKAIGHNKESDCCVCALKGRTWIESNYCIVGGKKYCFLGALKSNTNIR